MRKVLFFFVGLLSIVVIFFGIQYVLKQQQIKGISSYQECADAGFPVMESYPPQCRTSDGRTFTQYIGNELDLKDEILVQSPRPNQLLTNPQKITGKARGKWFFDGVSSGKLYDGNNKLLGEVTIHAVGIWMTVDFVPFTGDLRYSTAKTPTGTLKLRNANPSALRENHREIVIPVTFR